MWGGAVASPARPDPKVPRPTPGPLRTGPLGLLTRPYRRPQCGLPRGIGQQHRRRRSEHARTTAAAPGQGGQRGTRNEFGSAHGQQDLRVSDVGALDPRSHIVTGGFRGDGVHEGQSQWFGLVMARIRHVVEGALRFHQLGGHHGHAQKLQDRFEQQTGTGRCGVVLAGSREQMDAMASTAILVSRSVSVATGC